MAKGGNYRVKLRRRREGKTDYQARKALVTSGKPRLVTRGSLKNATVQITIAKLNGDEVLAAANSRELLKNYSWKAPTGNVPAAYLTGLLCGLKAKANGIEEAILDIGLVSPTKGSRTFAILSGVVDAGVNVPHSEEKIVKERMKGEQIAKYAKSLGSGSETYNAKFSKYTSEGIAPEKITEHFNAVKAEITDSFKTGKQIILPKEKKAPVKEAVAPVKKGKAPVMEEKVAPKQEKKSSAKKAVAKPKAAAKVEVPVKGEKAPAKNAAAKSKPKAKAPKEKAPAAPKEKVNKKGAKKA